MNRCGILAHVNEGEVVDKILGDPENPHNHGRTCAKGDAGFEGLTDPDRITTPLRRTNPEKGVGIDPGLGAGPARDRCGGLLVLPALSLGGSEPFEGLGWDPHGGDGAGLALEIVAGVAAGTALPVVLALVGAAAAGARDALAVTCFVLLVPGGFLLRLITLRVGIFPPVHIGGVGGRRPARSPVGG